jgi:tetratricopeptide (TPR) repeat protein
MTSARPEHLLGAAYAILRLHSMDNDSTEYAAVPQLEPESLAEVPLQARSLASLPPEEQTCYRQCRILLAAGSVLYMIQKDIPLAGLGVYEALLARSWEVRFADRQEMIRLAGVGVDVAFRLDPEELGAVRVAELQARALGELGNAYRTAERLDLAAEAFAKATRLLPPDGDPHLEARLFELHSSLLAAQGHFTRARGLLELVEGLYRLLGDPHLAGRALLTRALYTFYEGWTEAALRLTNEGMKLIDRERDPELFLLGLHNKLLFLVELGLHAQARRALTANRRNLVLRDPLKAARLRWVEGRISYGLGEWHTAEQAFHEAKQGLSHVGLKFHGALGALDLAMVLMKRGRVPEAESEVRAVREVLFLEDTRPEFLEPVMLLEASFHRREVTADLIQSTVAHLRRKELELGAVS